MPVSQKPRHRQRDLSPAQVEKIDWGWISTWASRTYVPKTKPLVGRPITCERCHKSTGTFLLISNSPKSYAHQNCLYIGKKRPSLRRVIRSKFSLGNLKLPRRKK